MKWTLLTIAMLISALTFSQEEKRAAVKGNNAYQNESYDEAIDHYEKSLELNEDYYEGGFNMGNALHRKAAEIAKQAQESEDQEEQQRLIEQSGVLNQQAANRFEMMIDKTDDKLEKAKAYHNMGNAQLMAGEIDKSIESYKNALRNNPDDDETRYNLAYAKKLKEQQEQQQQQQQEQEQEQDQEQDQQQNQDNQQEQNQEQEQEQNQDPSQEQPQDQQQQQPQPNQLSHEDAQEMLEAIQKDENEVQDKLKKKQSRAVQIEIEQDW